jgi:hypothetical protein
MVSSLDNSDGKQAQKTNISFSMADSHKPTVGKGRVTYPASSELVYHRDL